MASSINGFSLKEVCVRSVYWAVLSMALFALTLPVGLYQLNITGATPFLILTVRGWHYLLRHPHVVSPSRHVEGHQEVNLQVWRS